LQLSVDQYRPMSLTG